MKKSSTAVLVTALVLTSAMASAAVLTSYGALDGIVTLTAPTFFAGENRTLLVNQPPEEETNYSFEQGGVELGFLTEERGLSNFDYRPELEMFVQVDVADTDRDGDKPFNVDLVGGDGLIQNLQDQRYNRQQRLIRGRQGANGSFRPGNPTEPRNSMDCVETEEFVLEDGAVTSEFSVGNTEDCEYPEVSLVTYRPPPPVGNFERSEARKEIFDHESVRIEDGQSYELSAAIPTTDNVVDSSGNVLELRFFSEEENGDRTTACSVEVEVGEGGLLSDSCRAEALEDVDRLGYGIEGGSSLLDYNITADEDTRVEVSTDG